MEIRRSLNTSSSTASTTTSSESTEVDNYSESEDDVEGENIHDSQQEIFDQNDDAESSGSTLTSSGEIFSEMQKALGIVEVPDPAEAQRQLTGTPAPALALSPAPSPDVLSLIGLNASAVLKQEIDSFLASTSRGLQALLESSKFFQNLLKTDQIQISADKSTNMLSLLTSTT